MILLCTSCTSSDTYSEADTLWLSEQVAAVATGRTVVDFWDGTYVGELRPRPVVMSPARARLACTYVKTHEDFTSYFLLLGLRRACPERLKEIPVDTRARILVSALQMMMWVNDWSDLGPGPEGALDEEAAKALLETGAAALPHLNRLLGDKQPAPSWGSISGNNTYEVRRCDLAYRYAAILLGAHPVFHAAVPERDRDIESLKRRMDDIRGKIAQ
jgi:hypothetical protein